MATEQTQTEYVVMSDPDEEVIPAPERPEFGDPWALFRLLAGVIVIALIIVLISRLLRLRRLKRAAEDDGTTEEGPAPFQ